MADYLKVYGPIEEIKIVRDRSGNSLGFGFVEFKVFKDAKACMETTKRALSIDSFQITLEYSRKQHLADKGFGGTVEYKDWICANANVLLITVFIFPVCCKQFLKENLMFFLQNPKAFEPYDNDFLWTCSPEWEFFLIRL